MTPDLLIQQLPSEGQGFVVTLSSLLGISTTLLVWIVIGCIVYIVGLFILTQIHQKIVQKREKSLEAYTLSVDTLIYEAQKASANWTIDPASCAWIKDWDATQSYLESYDKLQTIAKTDFSEREIDLSKTYHSYRTIKGVENSLGIILVIVTIWAYKLFW